MNNNYNNINLQEQFLRIYLNSANSIELNEINNLLEQRQYNLIFEKVDEYAKKIVNDVDYKQIDLNGGTSGSSEYLTIDINKKGEFVDSQIFELYCILVLINKYLQEKNENKKRILEEEINKALNCYRFSEETENKHL